MKTFLVFIALILFVGLGPSMANAQGRGAMAQAQRVTGDQFPFAGRTPRGAVVYSVNRPNPALLSAIDSGLTDLFAAARRNGYGRHLNYSDYQVFIARADRTRDASGRYSPDIAVGAAQYAGTAYDRGGYIFAAGMVVSFNPSAFVIAEHTTDLGRVSNVVRYEGEHIVLYYNDRQRYSQTADHSRGGGHPILQ
jgi:hypothetical protein